MLFGIYLLVLAAWFRVSSMSDSMEIVKSLWSGLVLWAGCFEGCWLLLVVLCPLARVLVG